MFKKIVWFFIFQAAILPGGVWNLGSGLEVPGSAAGAGELKSEQTTNLGVPKPGADPILRERVQSTLASSSLLFVENVGQFDTEARYQVRLSGGSLWVTGTALWLTLRKDQAADSPASPDMARGGLNIKLSFEGGNPNPGLIPLKQLDSVISYFVGNAPDRWRSSVPVYSGIRMENLLRGVPGD